MPLLVLKLLLAPLLVGSASLVGRRFGSRATGILASLPIVAGPILLVFALEQGAGFAARAAHQTMSGVLSLGLYCLVYGRTALLMRKKTALRVALTLLLSWLAFGLCTLGLLRFPHGSLVAFGIGLAGLTVALIGLPRIERISHDAEDAATSTKKGNAGNLNSGNLNAGKENHARQADMRRGAVRLDRDLVIRMLAAAALVLALTEGAHRLGPSLSGLLTPFPVASTVLLVAEHATRGSGAAVLLLRGFLGGLYGFVFFCLIVSAAIVPLGIPLAFVLGLFGTLGAQFVLARSRAR